MSHLKMGITKGLALGNPVRVKGVAKNQRVGHDYRHHLSVFTVAPFSGLGSWVTKLHLSLIGIEKQSESG